MIIIALRKIFTHSITLVSNVDVVRNRFNCIGFFLLTSFFFLSTHKGNIQSLNLSASSSEEFLSQLIILKLLNTDFSGIFLLLISK